MEEEFERMLVVPKIEGETEENVIDTLRAYSSGLHIHKKVDPGDTVWWAENHEFIKAAGIRVLFNGVCGRNIFLCVSLLAANRVGTVSFGDMYLYMTAAEGSIHMEWEKILRDLRLRLDGVS